MTSPAIARVFRIALPAAALLLCGFPAAAPGQVSIGSGSTLSSGGWTVTGTDPIELRWGGELVAAYQTSGDLPKPFFYPFIGPTGENVTRHWPMKEGVAGEATDHIHQRSLWFGFGKIGGLDFWHEPASRGGKAEGLGKIVHTGLKGVQIRGSEQAIVLNATSDYVSFEHGGKICQDKRVFRLERREDGSLVLDATIILEASEGDLLIGDDKEGAFAIRVMPTLRLEGEVAKGAMRNSEGAEGKDVWGKRAKWVSYDGEDFAGRPLGIAIFDHPDSFRHPSWWHARPYGLFAVNPFGQSQFDKDAAPGAGDVTVKRGEDLTLRYRVLVHPGKADAEALEAEFARFAAQ